MTQASFSWQQLIYQFPGIKTVRPRQRNFKRFLGPGGVLWVLTIIVSMLIWDWQLLLAILVGIGVMLLAYSVQKLNWQQYWSQIYRLLNSVNSRLVLAISSGGLATVITYMTIAIWLEAKSPWIALATVIQGFGTLVTLIFLVCQVFYLQENRDEKRLDQLLQNLTEPDPLKRLIAVRQLNKFIGSQQVDVSLQQEVVNCLRLLLNQEKEVVIREAVVYSLQGLELFTSSNIWGKEEAF